jgi:hypothetical protein
MGRCHGRCGCHASTPPSKRRFCALASALPPPLAPPRFLLQGFLPESLDQFAQDVVLPAFTPTVGVLLAISTLYGLWKVGAPCLSSNTRSGGGCNTAGGAPVLLWPAHFSVACSLCLLADARCT